MTANGCQLAVGTTGGRDGSSRQPMSAFFSAASVRKLCAMIIALTVLVAPSVTYAALPIVASSHDSMPMMETGHCESPPAKSHGKTPAKSCCISMCMAVGIAPSAPATAVELGHAISYFAMQQSWHGFLGEIATPPPRLA